MDVFEAIYELYPTLSNEIINTYERIKDLKGYEKPEFLRLLANLRFSNENLYAHDEDQPSYDTLKEHFFNLMSDGLRLRNYCDLIAFGIHENMDNIIDDIKTLYYKHFDELQEEFYTC